MTNVVSTCHGYYSMAEDDGGQFSTFLSYSEGFKCIGSTVYRTHSGSLRKTQGDPATTTSQTTALCAYVQNGTTYTHNANATYKYQVFAIVYAGNIYY